MLHSPVFLPPVHPLSRHGADVVWDSGAQEHERSIADDEDEVWEEEEGGEDEFIKAEAAEADEDEREAREDGKAGRGHGSTPGGGRGQERHAGQGKEQRGWIGQVGGAGAEDVEEAMGLQAVGSQGGWWVSLTCVCVREREGERARVDGE